MTNLFYLTTNIFVSKCLLFFSGVRIYKIRCMVETDSASIKPMVGSASDYSSMGVTAAEFDRQRIIINSDILFFILREKRHYLIITSEVVTLCTRYNWPFFWQFDYLQTTNLFLWSLFICSHFVRKWFKIVFTCQAIEWIQWEKFI